MYLYFGFAILFSNYISPVCLLDVLSQNGTTPTDQEPGRRHWHNLILQVLKRGLVKDGRKFVWSPELLKQGKQAQASINQRHRAKALRQAPTAEQPADFIPFDSMTTQDPDTLQASFSQSIQESLIDMVAGSSMLEIKPYVETLGKNDYLVMGDQSSDKHVTIIPNDIFYAIQKPCVNWLHECSVFGIRQKLLTRVKSPYR